MVYRELTHNGYPSCFICKTEKWILQPRSLSYMTFRACAAIPCIQGTSKALSRIFLKYNMRIAHIPTSKLQNQLMNVKDRLSIELFPVVVYKIPCADCHKVYIGKTGKFSGLLKDHKRDSKNNSHTMNAIAKHVQEHTRLTGTTPLLLPKRPCHSSSC